MSLTFGHVLLSKAYGVAWRLARPILRCNPRLGDGFGRRLVPADWAEPADLWLQAASGGEAYLVWELLKELKSVSDGIAGEPARPLRILATTWTRQGLEVLQGMAAQLEAGRPVLRIQVTLFPLDEPALMYRAVRMVQPRLMVLLETELWPGLLMACTRRQVPVLVLNGRLAPRGARGYRLLRRVASDFWKAAGPRLVAAVSQADARRYAELLGQERTVVLPNIKFDRAVPRGGEHELQEENKNAAANLAALLPSARGVGRVLLASVREPEETLLLPAIKRLHGNGIFVIVAPRHLHRVAAWKTRLEEARISCRLRSSLGSGSSENPVRQEEVLIWDAFGELGALYDLSDAVFVGGSLAPLGGQNFLEPLSRGRIPCTGPHLDNFAWALGSLTDPSGGRHDSEAGRTLNETGLLEVCADADMLTDRLLERLKHPEPEQEIADRFRAWLAPRLGGAAAGAKLIAQNLQR